MTLSSVKRPIADIESPTESPTSTRARLAMSSSKPSTLAFAENKLDDATHKRLDDIVLEITDESSIGVMAGYMVLLTSIVQKSEGTLDQKYAADLSATRTLLKDHEELLEMLHAAWQKKSFRDIRNLRTNIAVTFRAYQDGIFPEILRPPPSRHVKLDDDPIAALAVKEAWTMPYNGENHQLLLDNINNMDREMPYSNTVAIIQSSGSGKSRLVHEQSNLVFTLPFNLRPQSDSKAMAYPPPDNEIRNHLLHTAELDESQIRCFQLLTNVFSLVSKVLVGWTQNENAVRTRPSQAERWRAYMGEGEGQNRKKLYVEATQLSTTDQLREWQERHAADLSLSDKEVAMKEAKERLKDLLQQIDDRGTGSAGAGKEKVKLMFYFDEAHVLATNSVVADANGKDMYDVLCSCFNYFTDLPIFAIFLSTNSNIDQLAPQGFLAKSARMRETTLQAPITETPFDCSPDIEVTPGELKLDDLCRVEFMARFGRPMWWTMLPRLGNEKNRLWKRMIDLARAKLICHNNLKMTRSTMSASAVTAILDVLLSLDFEPSREKAKKIQGEMVASHMRTAFSVPSDRAYIRSGYPSEPILAEAAAQQMNELQSQKPHVNMMAELLSDQFESGLIDRGLRGELVWRQLVMEAYLRGVRTEQSERKEEGYKFSEGCRLVTFIKELFSEPYASAILDSFSDNVAALPAFKTTFDDAWVRFTHFGKMADDTGLTSPALLAAFVRGMAIICWSSQERVDMGIPVLLHRDAFLTESSMTAVLVQVKLRRTEGNYSIDEHDVGLLWGSDDQPRPYVAIVAELGVQLPRSPYAVTRALVSKKLNETMTSTVEPMKKKKGKPHTAMQKKGKRNTAMQTPTKSAVAASSQTTPSRFTISSPAKRVTRSTATKPPRYSIFAYGCSNTVYRVIDKNSRNLYSQLLAHKDFVDEHPRSDQTSLEAVRRLKPFWAIGEACYHWIKSPLRDFMMDKNDDEDSNTMQPGSGKIQPLFHPVSGGL